MNLFIALSAVLLATCVVVGYLLFIWWLDRYEREPIYMIGLTFLWGALGGTTLGCGINTILDAFAKIVISEQVTTVMSTVIFAPVSEEFTKALIFLPLLFTRHIDNETDGLIYGAAAGLGFATIENILYFAGAVQNGAVAFFTLIVMRTMFSALVHCISSALFGMAVGMVRHRPTSARTLIVLAIGFALAVTNHALWNGITVFSSTQEATQTQIVLMLVNMTLVVIASLTMFALTQLSLNREHKLIARHLQQEAEEFATFPHHHAAIVPFWRKRRKSGWLEPHIAKDRYIRELTLLAFRRHQLELADENKRDKYLGDIQHFRQSIHQLLSDPSSR